MDTAGFEPTHFEAKGVTTMFPGTATKELLTRAWIERLNETKLDAPFFRPRFIVGGLTCCDVRQMGLVLSTFYTD